MAGVTCSEVRTAALLSCAAAYKGNAIMSASCSSSPAAGAEQQHPWAKHVPTDCLGADPGCLPRYLSDLEDLQTFGNAEGGVYGRLAVDRCSRRCWVVFRGTRDVKSWLHNLDFDHAEVPGITGRVHSGFATQLKAALPVIDSYMKGRCPHGFSIYTTGHSLGGALATMYASYAKRSKPGVGVCCVVFGSPRAGDSAFAEALTRASGARVLRLNMWTGGDADDRVTHLPAARTGFQHAGEHRLLRFGAAPDPKLSLVSRMMEVHHQHRYLKAVFSLPSVDDRAFGAALEAMPREELPDSAMAELVQIGASACRKLSSAGFLTSSMKGMSSLGPLLQAGMSLYNHQARQPDARVLDEDD